jgi:hypothetical protein
VTAVAVDLHGAPGALAVDAAILLALNGTGARRVRAGFLFSLVGHLGVSSVEVDLLRRKLLCQTGARSQWILDFRFWIIRAAKAEPPKSDFKLKWHANPKSQI